MDSLFYRCQAVWLVAKTTSSWKKAVKKETKIGRVLVQEWINFKIEVDR